MHRKIIKVKWAHSARQGSSDWQAVCHPAAVMQHPGQDSWSRCGGSENEWKLSGWVQRETGTLFDPSCSVWSLLLLYSPLVDIRPRTRPQKSWGCFWIGCKGSKKKTVSTDGSNQFLIIIVIYYNYNLIILMWKLKYCTVSLACSFLPHSLCNVIVWVWRLCEHS